MVASAVAGPGAASNVRSSEVADCGPRPKRRAVRRAKWWASAAMCTVDLEGGPEWFEHIVANPLAADQFVHTLHAALTVYDLPDLRAAVR